MRSCDVAIEGFRRRVRYVGDRRVARFSDRRAIALCERQFMLVGWS